MNKTIIIEHLKDLIDKNNAKNQYTDLQWFYRIESNITLLVEKYKDEINNEDDIYLASYLILFVHLEESHGFYDFTLEQLQKSKQHFSQLFEIDKITLQHAFELATDAVINNKYPTLPSQIVSDALLMDLSCPVNGENRIYKIYDQLVAKGIYETKTSWFDKNVEYLTTKQFYTIYAIENFSDHKEKITKKLKKETKAIHHQHDLIIEKELDISETELKELKKRLSKIKNRDDRGIQTLFRTTSKNHYTLKALVDGKARIMITVNSIILSLIIGQVIGTKEISNIYRQLPFIAFAIVNVLSILFAVIAITPIQTQGKFTEKEVRNKQGNLLYFGNFHKMKYQDFEWGFLQMLNDKDYLYLSFIKDLFYQGVQLQKKFRFIRFSLNIFLLGIIITAILYLITTINQCM